MLNAIRLAVGSGGGGSSVWGAITGTLSNQTDLQTALNLKANSSSLGSMATQDSSAVSITGGSIVAALVEAGYISLADGGGLSSAQLSFTGSNNPQYTFRDLVGGGILVSTGDTGTVTGNMLAGDISLTTKVTGILPSANGGTGVNNTGSLINASNTTITNGGTLALGGFTLTVPTHGTAALLGVANVFTGAQSCPSLSITGTAGAGFINFLTQSSTPTAPASGFGIHADSTGRFCWRRASDGFTRTFDVTATANRVYTLPDATTTLAGLAVLNVFSAAQTISTGSDVATNLKIMNATGATPRVQMGTLATSTTYGAVYLGNVTPGATNFTLVGDGSGNTYLNATAIRFSAGNTEHSNISATQFNLLASQPIAWSNNVFLVPKALALATLQLGVDAAGVTNQMLTAASRITSNGVGANLTIAPGNCRGTTGEGGVGGTLILSTYVASGSTNTIGTLTSRMTFDTAGAIAFPNVTAVVTETVVSDRTLAVTINGTAYKFCLKV